MKRSFFSAYSFENYFASLQTRTLRPIRQFLVFLLVGALSLFSFDSFSQGEIPVNMYTGQPSIGVPISVLSSGDISVPVSLSYDPNNQNDKNILGQGWSLNAGGSVSREVRGLPDDFGSGDTRKGWLYDKAIELSVAQDVANFVPRSDTVANMTSEAIDNAKLDTYRGTFDTEPDIFYYSCGGVSGSFVFDNGHLIRTMPYRDVKIEPSFVSSSNKTITSFVITTSDGFKYTFGQVVTASKQATKDTYPATIHFFTTEFELYENPVSYNAQWMLTRIDSPNGGFVTFVYDVTVEESFTQEVNVGYYMDAPVGTIDPDYPEVVTIYKVEGSTTKRYPSLIEGSSGMKVSFSYRAESETHHYLVPGVTSYVSLAKFVTHPMLLRKIDVSDLRKGSSVDASYVKSYNLDFGDISLLNNGNPLPKGTRWYLRSLTEVSGCDLMPPTTFSYLNIDEENLEVSTRINAWGNEAGFAKKQHNMPKVYIYPEEPEHERYRLLPIPNYSGNEIVLEGEDRAVGMHPNGSLKSIKYPQGATTSFVFMPNEYLDERTNLNAFAGGLRVTRITYYDGFSSTPVTKIFEYKDPVSGKSSGKLLRKPVFAFPVYKWKNPWNQNLAGAQYEKNFSELSGDNVWKYLTVRTDTDITPAETTQGSTVGYSFVTVKRPGAGKATFEYHQPGLFGDSVSSDWTSTINRFARPNISPAPAMGVVQHGGTWRFPHSPNPEFDFARGLLWRKSDYNDAGKLVQQTKTTYQPLNKGANAVKVWGLRYDRYALAEDGNANRRIYFYGKYFLLTDADFVPKKEVTMTYDVNDISGLKVAKDSTLYGYNTTHKQLAYVKQFAPDGTIRTKNFRYPKDFPNLTSTAENAVLALSDMQTNFKHAAPVETLSTLRKPGDATTYLTGASLVKFNTYVSTNPLPESAWSIPLESPIDSATFQLSSIQLVSGTYKIVLDSRYTQMSANSAYTSQGQLITSRDVIGRKSASTLYSSSTSLPVLQVSNADSSQVAFADFENITRVDFSHPSGSTPYYGTGRSGANAFYPGVLLKRKVAKAAVNNYVLSFWIKSNAVVDFTVKLKNNAGTLEFASIPLSVSSSGGTTFKYVQTIIPVNSVTDPGFLITLQAASLTVPPGGGSAPGLLPVIDDVFFFPENATMGSIDYTIPYGPSMITSATGEASHTVYDKLGRVKYLKDRDLNIVKKISYHFVTDPDPLFAEFDVSGVTTGQRSYFRAKPNPCLTGLTYYWDLGSGFVQSADTISQIYYTPGTQSISLKVTHPLHGERTVIRNFNVNYPPPSVGICAKGVIDYNVQYPASTVVADCPAITATPPSNGIIFRVSNTFCPGNCSYTWKLKEHSGFSWVVVGSGIQYTYPKLTPATQNFQIVCEILPEDGGPVISTPIDVIIRP
jgi:hypothetical protein